MPVSEPPDEVASRARPCIPHSALRTPHLVVPRSDFRVHNFLPFTSFHCSCAERRRSASRSPSITANTPSTSARVAPVFSAPRRWGVQLVGGAEHGDLCHGAQLAALEIEPRPADHLAVRVH